MDTFIRDSRGDGNVCVQYDAEEEDGTPMAVEGTAADMLIDPFAAARPAYLADPDERGIKRVGIIYSPRKSWWAGVSMVVLSIAIFIITMWTAFAPGHATRHDHNG